MANLEEALAQGVKDGKIPHAIVFATNKDGSQKYSHATGFQNYGVNEEPIQEDAIMMLASQTKLLTSIAALQIVEQGLIGLDEDVCPHLPELAAQPILRGFDEDGKPQLAERKKQITIRHLLSHSSGASYAIMPDIMQYAMKTGNSVRSNAPTVLERSEMPLIAEPGENWRYSTGLDWAGLLIERLSGSSLEDFMATNIFQPLDITGITFFPEKNPALKDKVPGLTMRDSDGKLESYTGNTLNTGSIDCFGGHGGYASMGDFLKVLQSLLANDGRLLEQAMVDTMFEPQLGEASEKAFYDFVENFNGMIPGDYTPKMPVNYGLGGMLFMEDDVGRRKKGTMAWGGMVNPFWLIDREANVAFTFGTQVLPPGDPGCKEMTGLAERAIYKMFGVK